jgi:hypothetical protein
VTAFLLDVNVLIALMDPAHVRHDDAHEWFLGIGGKSWATCPLTQNAVIRILSDARYPNSPGTPARIVPMLAEFVGLSGHVFWPDDITMLDPQKLDATRLLSSRQVTDSYLLALAQAHGGRLATLDRRLVTDAVMGGAQALHVIE